MLGRRWSTNNKVQQQQAVGMLQSRSPSPDSPSQVLRESIRARKGQSMPLVPAVMQAMSPGTGSGQASPTASIRSSHSAHNNNNNNNNGSGINMHTSAGHTPPLLNMQSTVVHPRPVPLPRIAPPQVLQQRAAMEEEEIEAQARREDKNIKMTDALLADLARASYQQQQQQQVQYEGGIKGYSPKQEYEKYSPKQPTNTSPHLHGHSPTSSRRNSNNAANHSPTFPTHQQSQHSPNLSSSGYNNGNMSNLNLNANPTQVRTPDRSLPVQELEEEVVMRVGDDQRSSPRDNNPSSRPAPQQQRHWSNNNSVAGSSLVRARSPLGLYDAANVDEGSDHDRNRSLSNRHNTSHRRHEVQEEQQYDGRHSRTEHRREEDSDEEIQARYVAQVEGDDDGETLIEDGDENGNTLAPPEQNGNNESESEGHTPRSPGSVVLPTVGSFGAFLDNNQEQGQTGYTREQLQNMYNREQAQNGHSREPQNSHPREQVQNSHPREQVQNGHPREQVQNGHPREQQQQQVIRDHYQQPQHKRRHSSDQPSNPQASREQIQPTRAQPPPAVDHHATVRARKHRSGATDQLGLQVFDPGMFEGSSNTNVNNPKPQPTSHNSAPNVHIGQTGRQSVASSANFSEEEAAYAYYLQMFPHESRLGPVPPPSNESHLPRPNAPIPPTPVSQSEYRDAAEEARWRYTPAAYSSEGGPDGLDAVPEFAPGELRRLLYGRQQQEQNNNGNSVANMSPSPSQASPAPGSPFYARGYSGSPYPYPYPFSHVQRGGNHMNYAVYPRVQPRGVTPATTVQSEDVNVPNNEIDNAALQAEMARQWQVYAMNNNQPQPMQQYQQDAGMMSDSTLGTSPGVPIGYTPWALLHMNRTMGGVDSGANFDPRSLQSSPSHEPIPLGAGPRLKRKDHLLLYNQNGVSAAAAAKTKRTNSRRKPPPRVDSTQPRETSPELELESESESSTAGEDDHGTTANEVRWEVAPAVAPTIEESISMNASIEYEDDWVDDDGDAYGDEEDEILELPVHPTYVKDLGKRRKRWESRWGELVRAFQALDRQTDATLVLLATPSPRNAPSFNDGSDSSSISSANTKRRALHLLTSRSIRRTDSVTKSLEISNLRQSFASISERVAGSGTISPSTSPQIPQQQAKLYSQFNTTSANLNSPEMTLLDTIESIGPGSSNEELRKALQRAIGAMGAMGAMYERREARWRDELERVGEEKGVVDVLLGRVMAAKAAEETNGTPPDLEQPVILGRAI